MTAGLEVVALNSPPSVSRYGELSQQAVDTAWDHLQARLIGADEERHNLIAGLPGSHRPLLSAAQLIELSLLDEQPLSTDTTGPQPLPELFRRSRIDNINRLPYEALHLPDVIDDLGGISNIDIDKLYEYFCEPPSESLEGRRERHINSSLRNALLARELNRTILRDSEYKARLAITEYTWQDRLSAVHNQQAPELPAGFENLPLAKFVITLVKDDDPTKRLVFFDYGETDGDERRATGEDLSMLSLWSVLPIDPENAEQLRAGLQYIASRQGGEIGRKGVELLNKSRRLISTVEIIAQAETLPLTLAKVEDLSESQIDGLSHVAQLIMEMWRIFTGDDNLKYQRVVPWKELLTAIVQTKQPSTRTVLAAMMAAHAAGLKAIELDQSKSSQAKGESPASERLTFLAQNIGAILSRDPQFEPRTTELEISEEHEEGPIRISLGGDRHHPSQTLAELLTFTEEFGCSSLEELREKTEANPPTIMFIGHVDYKRADKSLIEFIAKHLPDWKIKVIVPAHIYKPTNLDLPPGAQYEAMANADIADQGVLEKLTKGVRFVYIANAEGTAEGKGFGDGLGKPDYYLSAQVVANNNLQVLAPLPASGELDPAILTDQRYNQLITRTMEYKNAVLAAALLLMIKSQQLRLAATKANR